MRFWSKGGFWWLVLCVVSVYLVDLFTFKPNVISGNGNLGLLFVVLALIIFGLAARSLWKGFGKLQFAFPAWLIIYSVAVMALLLFSVLEYTFVIKLIEDLGGSAEEPNSKIYRFPLINQYTNTMFINFYTLGIMVSGLALIKSIINKFKTAGSQGM